MPLDPTGCWILLFPSIHHVLAAEAIFKERGIWHDVIPVPRGLSSDCGMAIAFCPEDREAVRHTLADRRVRVRGVYRPDQGSYEEVTL